MESVRETFMRPDWLNGHTHKDWLFDDRPIRGKVMRARFENLDWSRARVDMEDLYWNVPLDRTIIDGTVYDKGGTVHRLSLCADGYPIRIEHIRQPISSFRVVSEWHGSIDDFTRLEFAKNHAVYLAKEIHEFEQEATPSS